MANDKSKLNKKYNLVLLYERIFNNLLILVFSVKLLFLILYVKHFLLYFRL